ncbi:calpain-5-like [Pseudophryne corroboree]|uniref:calpain-5-like n=1 Tax=Pseudophryne corroboree TaxID=495146 RepID=UPI003081C231
MVLHYQEQRYDHLKTQCRQQKHLFEDPKFPADDSSLYYSRRPPRVVEWKRPQELVQSPRLFSDAGISPRDLQQGSLGNCWFVAAVSCLAGDPSIWKKVIPSPQEQDWPRPGGAPHLGIFRFRFWRFGRWLEVVIDDRLPTSGGELLFCRPGRDGNVFWCSLLEKAYAKLIGSYESLDGGSTAEALIDFTGGVSEAIDLLERNSETEEEKKKLFKAVLKAHSRASLICSSIRPSPSQGFEEVLSSGLVTGHAYSITSVKSITLHSGLLSLFRTHKLRLVRLQNPWGSGEWKGPWSDGSEEWKKVSRRQKEKMGVTVNDDGEFWMSWDDFCTHFTDVTVCRRVNTHLLSSHKTWKEETAFSAWRQNPDPLKDRSGGCPNNKTTYLHNPQFCFDVTLDHDSVLISLEQEDRRTQRSAGGGDNLPIGFFVFKVEVNRKYRLHCVAAKASSSTYINSRSVLVHTELQGGRYVILPTTFQPGQAGSFLLRVYTDRASHLRELTQDVPEPSCLSFCLGVPRVVTSITVHAASSLAVPSNDSDPAVYVTVHCEGHKARSRTVKGRNPEFDLKAVFYRKRQSRPLIVQVWLSRWARDTLLGTASVPCAVGESNQTSVHKLQRKDGTTSGYIMTVASSSSDLTAL